jgi:peptidoglycan/xylan/chitin deacetylase (PgdA/CDA1 family)
LSVRTAKRILALTISLAYALVRRHPRTTVVMTYHSVSEHELDAFESQMRTLRIRGRATFADDASPKSGPPSVAVTFDDALESVFDGALRIMAALQIPATVFVPTGYMGAEARWQSVRGAENRPAGRVAAAERLKAMDPRLVKLGSHTVSHPSLAALAVADLERELRASKRTLEDITGASVTMLSLPYGSYDARVIDTARANGYDWVFANVPVGRLEGASGILRGRINVSPRDWPLEFRLKASGAYDWMVLAMPLKRALLKPFRKSNDHEIRE